MKNFDELYTMYRNGDEAIYDELEDADFEELYKECNEDLAKYYGFGGWLWGVSEYYKKEEK